MMFGTTTYKISYAMFMYIAMYNLNPAPTITYGLKRFAFKARFMILILTI